MSTGDLALCPCGCGGPGRTPKGYAGRSCYLRMITPDQRRKNFHRWLETCEDARRVLSEAGSRGGRDSLVERWGALLEQWQSLGPREALRAAYTRGYQSGHLAGAKRVQRRHDAVSRRTDE